ncbi:hypothetical protein ACPOL_1595 [Acidisarcina polymorpha]|uniref:Uncharacterized protein n=1 Tax=Acidisarcina polymorpha TaxID=2211140 RepID=A0A2Z5FVR6_9BACT|nr:hypothetical protein ACPOL_1595 [Acidisarcina polymorpha]
MHTSLTLSQAKKTLLPYRLYLVDEGSGYTDAEMPDPE